MLCNKFITALALLACPFNIVAISLSSSSLIDGTDVLAPRDGKGSVVTSPVGLTWYEPDLSCGAPARDVSVYTCYSGPASNFPNISAWTSFDKMWDVQMKYALASNGDTTKEVADIRSSIVKVSKQAKVDARVILAVIIHESFGYVNVSCTTSYSGVHNCGLMQAYNSSSFDPTHPIASITQMVRDGTQGTAYGPGLVQLFNDAVDTDQETNGNVYAVFRAYNSGSVDADNLSNGEGADASYVSDMANYLQGWNGYGDGPDACTFTTTTTTTTTTSSIQTTCASSAYVTPPAPTDTGTTSQCCEYHTVVSGDYCALVESDYDITAAEFLAWNAGINSGCTNLFLGDAYCVSSDLTVGNSTTSITSASTTAISTSTPATSTSTAATTTSTTETPTSTGSATCVSSAFVPPPESTVTGSTADCCEWYTVASGDDCEKIDMEFGITLAQFQAWNTYIDDTCSNLWAGYAYCVDSNLA